MAQILYLTYYCNISNNNIKIISVQSSHNYVAMYKVFVAWTLSYAAYAKTTHNASQQKLTSIGHVQIEMHSITTAVDKRTLYRYAKYAQLASSCVFMNTLISMYFERVFK